MAGDIFDKDMNPVEAYVQLYTINKKNNLKTWSDIRETEDSSMNINLGDIDISGQDNVLGLADASNEFVVIAVWTKDSPDRFTNAKQFTYIVQELSGEEVYIQNIQLQEIEPIGCSDWYLPESVIVNEQIVAISNNSNKRTYEVFNKTHYQYKKQFNEIIFNFVGPFKTHFDFGDSYSESNIFVPLDSSLLEVKLRVIDYYGNQSICTKSIKVFYKVNSCFNLSPDVISKGTEVTVESCATGNIDKIVKTNYYLGDEKIIGDFSKIIDLYGDFTVKQEIIYYNGFDYITITLDKTFEMTNINPTISLEGTELDSNSYEFSHNGEDEDGTIEKVKWEILRNNQDINGIDNWSLYYSTGEIEDLSNWFYDFNDILGKLKVKATVYDNLNGSASDEFLFDIECPECIIPVCEPLSFNNIDFTKKIKQISFDSCTKKIKIEMTKRSSVYFDNEIKKIEFTTDNRKIRFSNETRKIRFSHKRK